MAHLTSILVCIAVLAVAICEVQAKRRAANMLQKRETNTFTFVRLIVMRLVYGFAKLFGFGEPLSEVLDGAFVPPGAEEDDDDYGDYF